MVYPLPIEQHQRRLELYTSGLGDREIERQLGLTRATITSWRRKHGLGPNNQRGVSADEEARRLALYVEGRSDVDIARMVGVGQSKIHAWRTRRGLPVIQRWVAAMSIDQNAARLLLYQMRYSDRRIAHEQHVHCSVVQKWRRRRGLPAHASVRVNGRFAAAQQDSADTTFERCKRAIGRALPPDIRDDAVADLYLAVLTGAVALEKIEAMARRFGNRVLDKFASRYGPRSLDEELGDEDGFRMVDLLRDERSSSWLEDMGATVW